MDYQRITRWFHLALIFFGLFLAFGAFGYSNAMNLRRSSPQTAYSLYRDDPGVIAAHYNDLANKGERLILTEVDRYELQEALRADPLNRMLLRSLGVWYDLNREPKKAFAGMRLSSTVSRRDIISQLWLVEYWMRQSNLGLAYRHIDIALKVHPQLSVLLYPKLNSLIVNPSVAAKVELAAKSEVRWVPGLADYVVAQDSSTAYALLTRPNFIAKSATYAGAFRSLAHNLARSGSIDRARTIANAMVPPERYQQWAEFALNRWNTDPGFGHLSWLNNPDYSSLIPMEGEEVELQASVPSDQTVELLGRGMFLSEGSGYQIEGVINSDADFSDIQLQWSLACWRLAGEERYFVNKLPRNAGSGKFSLTFQVPERCPYTKVVLQAIGGSTGTPAEFILRSLKLTKTAKDQGSDAAVMPFQS